MSTDAKDTARLRGVPLIDGIDKVTGRARYTADLDHADALVGRILRSPVSHGEIPAEGLRAYACAIGDLAASSYAACYCVE